MSDLLLRDGEWDVVDPGSAGWRYLSFRVDRLRDGENVTRNTGGEEIALVPLGGRCAVDTGGERYELGGRASVFDGMPWALYLPRDTEYTMTALGDVEVAVSGALADERLEPLQSSLRRSNPAERFVSPAASSRTNLDFLVQAFQEDTDVQELHSLSQDLGSHGVNCCAWIF